LSVRHVKHGGSEERQNERRGSRVRQKVSRVFILQEGGTSCGIDTSVS
jgi:hypothetical protein